MYNIFNLSRSVFIACYFSLEKLDFFFFFLTSA